MGDVISLVAKGFFYIGQNCSDVKYFVVQADLLKQRFLPKEYKEELLDQEIKEVLNIIDRKYDLSFITSFSNPCGQQYTEGKFT